MAVSGVPTNALAEAAREVSGQSDGWEMPDEQVTSEQLRERENESVPEEESTGSSEQPQEQTEQDVPEPSGEDPPAGDEQVPEPADEQVPEEEAPDGTYVPEEEVSAEGENSTEERNTEDTLTFEDNSIKVTATLADASALPAGTELVVTPVTPTTDGYDYDAYMGALNDSVKKENPYNEKNTLLYDVSFVAADEEGKAIEVEPAEGTVTVNFEFKQQQLSDDLGAKKADDVTVTHLPESDGKIEVEKIADATGTGEEQIEITTDSFSVYAFSYTVDFTYDDFTYSIAGETNILLSKLFEILGIEEDVADVKDVTFTNTDFVKVEKKGDDWLLTSLKPFTSDETLTVELFNGAKYVIAVTDAQAQKLTETFEESSFNLDIGGQFNPYANFGLVAFDSLELRAHTNSNFATKHLTTNVNAGTRIPSPGEVFYIGESINKEMTFDLNANTGGYNGSKVVFGKDILLDVGADAYVNGGQKLTVNGPSGDQLRDVVVSESDDKKFIDLSAWQQAVAALSADFMRFPSTQISKQQSTSSDYVLFVERTNASVASLNLDASDLTAKIKIDDRAVSDRSHIMIINIDAKGQDSVALPGLEIEPNTDGNGIAYTGELHDRWTQGNFVINVVDSTQQDGMFRGTFTTDGATSASIIAPYGTVVAAQNVNGIILAENIKVIAEFHRDSITYTNKITVKGGLKAAKEVNGSRETDQTFDFVLESIDGSPMPEGAENGRLTAQNELDGMIIFGYLDFATAGDYRYKLYEDVPVDGVTLDDGRVLKSGIVYDPTQYIVVVHATDSGTGIGIGGYTIYDASTNKEIKTITYDEGKTGVVTFENSTASGTAYIKATKQFSSGWPEGQTFQFKLTGKNFIRENGTDGGVPGMWDIVDKPSGAGTVIDYSNNSMTVTVSENSPTVVFGGLNLIQNGAIQQDRLGTYTYTIQEVIPAGADYSADRTIATKDGIVYDAREHTVAVKAIKSGNEYAVVVLYDGTDSKLTVTNTNTNYEIGKLTVLKHVSPDDAASSAGEDAEFKVTVTNADGQYINADGSTSTNKVELTVTPRTPLVIEGLALRTTYTVTETGQATVNRWHYTATGSTITGSATLDAENKEATVNLTNNYEQYGSLNVSKSVTGDGSTIEGISSKPFTIYVEKDGTYYWMGTSGIESGTTKTGSTIIGQGSVTLAGLPLGTYNVTEDEAGAKVDGYSLDVTTGSAIVTADETANVAVTNNYTKQADNKTSVSGTKTWLDGGKNHDNANEVTLTLKRTSSKYTTPQAVTATPAWNGDTYTFANLDKNDDEGNPYTYEVTEGAINGYTSTKVEGTNNFVNKSDEKVSVSVEKIWNDSNNQDQKRPTSITVRLHAGSEQVGSEITLSESDQWKHTWSDLYKYDQTTGAAIVYTVTEDEVSNYSTQITQKDNSENSYVVTNSYTPGQTSVTVEKEWIDGDNAKRTRPASVSVQLLADGEASGGPVTLDASKNWEYTWTGLPEKKDGKAIVYTVSEEQVNGYAAPEITGSAEQGFVIKNKLSGTVEVSGTKTWLDGGKTHDNAKEITLTLKRKSAKPDSVEESVEASATWTNNTYTFGSQPKYDDYGYEYTYTVSEREIEGYSTTQDGYNITNTIEPAGVTITKQWNDFANEDHSRPTADSFKAKLNLFAKVGEGQSIEVTDVYANDLTVTDNSNGTYTATWANLPQVDENGQSIVYTVTEDSITGYTSSTNDPISDGGTLINTHMPTIDIRGHKVWDDEESAKETTRKPITVQLQSRNGDGAEWANVEGRTAVPSGEDLSFAFEALPKYYGNTTDTLIQYQVVETEVPAGYTATDGNASNGYTITNSLKKGERVLPVELTIHKTDDKNVNLPGAVYEVTATGETQTGSECGEYTTDSDGKAFVTFTTPGTWKLEEKTAPAGYLLNDAEYVIVVNQSGDVEVKLEEDDVWTWIYHLIFGSPQLAEGNVLNVTDAPTRVSVSKTDIANGEEVDGATIQIIETVKKEDGTTEEKVVEQWVSGKVEGEEGPHLIEGLKTGVEYTLRETVAPDGYAVATDTTFTIDETGKVTTTGSISEGGVLLVEDAKTKVSVSKTDITGEEELKGAHIQIIDSEGKVVELDGEKLEWDSDGSAHVVEGLKTGIEYTLRETVAPEGYTIATDTTFTIDERGKVKVGDTVVEDNHVLIKDAKTKVKVSKTDIADGEEVEGATIQIIETVKKEDGTTEEKVVEQWVSGKVEGEEGPHLIEGLKTGVEYTLRETVAPDGYAVATDTTFTIDETGKVTTTGSISEGGVLLVEDAKTKVSVSKTDITGEEELKGAHIQIIDSEGKVVELDGEKLEWDSDGSAHVVEGLKTGIEYTLRETVAPEGYTIATDTTFTIDERGKVKVGDTVVEDNHVLIKDAKTKVKVSKTDIASGEELEGAQIQIIDSKGKVVEKWTSTKDNESTDNVDESVHVIEGLKTGEEYTLRETVAPDGYAVATDTTFTIDEKGKVTTTGSVTEDGVLLVEDALTKVSVSKVAVGGGEELAGAKIQLMHENAEGELEVVQLGGNDVEWTSEKGKAHEIVGLKAGDYVLHETVAPAGYAIATDIAFTLNADGTVTTKAKTSSSGAILIEDALTTVSIKKTDIADGFELPGAKMKVVYAGDNGEEEVFDQWVSGEEAHEVKGLVAGVVYTLREVVAPAGYAIATETTFALNADGTIDASKTSTKVQDGELLVEDAKTKITVSKTDITGEEELKGAHMQVLNASGEVVVLGGEKLEWNSDGSAHVITGLKTGVKYTLRETVAPEGYTIATDTEFVIREDGSVTIGKETIENNHILIKDAKNRVLVSKTDITGDEELEGARLRVLDSKGVEVDAWTTKKDQTGTVKHLIEGLKVGETYTLREEVAPDGYTVATDTTFTVDEKGNVSTKGATTTDGDGNTVLLVKDAKTKVKVAKTDVTDADNHEIAGAHIQIMAKGEGDELEVVKLDGKPLEWISEEGASREVVGLTAGIEYTLRETVAPAGYAIATDVTFTIQPDGTVKASAPVTKDGVILVQDAITEVSISKHDVTNDKELAGATIQILDGDGKVVELKRGNKTEKLEWVSTTEAHVIKGLATGVEYTLHEETAPKGYKVAADTTFKINADGTVETKGATIATASGKTVLLVNDAMTTVKVSKTDVTDEDNHELAGATIQILYTDASGKEQEFTSWTSTNEAHEVVGLEAGVEYILRETVAPDGYTIASDTKFSIDKDGTVKSGGTTVQDGHLLVKDALTKVSVSKKAVGGEDELPGAKIQILDGDGEVVELKRGNKTEKLEWTSGTEAKEIEGLKTGVTYTLRETVAPDGYTVASDIKFSIDERGNVTVGDKQVQGGALLIEDSLTKVYVSKWDITGQKEVKGAYIQIIAVDEEDHETVVDEWTSTTKPHKVEGKLNVGTQYILREVTAPDGYAVTAETHFQLKSDGTLDTAKTSTHTKDIGGKEVLLVEDAQTVVKVSKVATGAGDELAGAHIQVLDKDGKVVAQWDSEADDEATEDRNEGIHEVVGLKGNAEYTLRETVAPAGYAVTTDTTFYLNADGTIDEQKTETRVSDDGVLLVEDDATAVIISKRDIAGDEELPGAQMKITFRDDAGQERTFAAWTSGQVEGEDGPHVVAGLKTGVEYTLVETTAPDGYAITAATKFQLKADGTIDAQKSTVQTKSENDKTIIVVKDAPTKVSVSKVAVGGGEEIAGAQIQLMAKDEDGELQVVRLGKGDDAKDVAWTSEAGKAHDIVGLNPGAYTLRETVAPDGYAIATDIEFTLNKDGSITTTARKSDSGAILVEDALTKVKVTKRDVSNGGEELPGATMRVLDADGKVVKIGGEKVEWVSTDEPHVIEGLKTGVEYTLRETVAPDGYAVATDITFTIAEDGTVSVTGTAGGQAEDGTILVEDALTRVTISKADVDGGAEVPGATIQILDEDGNVVKINGKKVEWVSTDEPHEVVGLKTGVEYTLHETVAPDGYAFSTDTTFTINADGTVEVISAKSKDKDGKTVLVVEDAMTEVRVSKVETGAGEELAGAHIQILDEDGNIITEWDSLADDEATEDVNEGIHVVKGLLNTGVTYTLRETVAPDGYTLTSDTTFSIAEDGKVKANGTKTIDDEGNTVLLVEDAKTKVTVSKTDIANGEELPGATIQIIDSEGEVVEEWVSTDKPHDIEGLKTGVEYTLRETVAPDGYAIATDTTFTIDENGKVTSSGSITEGGVLLVEDAKTSVKVSKRDATSGAELPGAHMQILDSAGNVVEKWVSTTETRVFEGLKTGETYTLRETVAPEGYAVTTDTTFQIAADGTVTTNDTVAKDGIILVEDYKLGEIVDKYVNGKPHMDANLGEEFEYEILAFVTSDAVYGEIEDVLDKRLVFASTDPSSVTVEDIGTVKDVTAKGTALDASNVEVRIDGQTLIVGLSNLQDEAVGLTNHWVRVAFRAKLAEGVNTAADIDNVANYKIANFMPGLEWEPTYGSTTPFASVTPVVSVEKVWQNAEGEDVDWPEGATVTVELLSDGEPLDPAYTEVLSADQTSATFTGMEAGHEYTVRETEVSGATVTESVVTGSALEGFTITNKLPAEEPVNSREIGVSKVWEDADGNEMDWPEGASVTIELFCDGESLDPARVVELTADNTESTFEVENFDESAEYTVRETRITDGGGIYKYQKTGDVEEGFVVTNRLESAEPDGDTVEVEVAKEWLRDGDSIDWPEGAEVTVELLKDGKSLDPAVTLVLTEDEDTGTFSELPAGAKYTVKEIKVSGAPTGFKKSIEGSAEEGYTITNEYPATEEESVKPEDSKKSEDSTKASENTNASTTTTGTKSTPYTSTVGSGTSGSSTTRTSTPRTGDPTSVVAAITLMASGLATLGYGVRRRRRK